VEGKLEDLVKKGLAREVRASDFELFAYTLSNDFEVASQQEHATLDIQENLHYFQKLDGPYGNKTVQVVYENDDLWVFT
jgi:hypothetical protein